MAERSRSQKRAVAAAICMIKMLKSIVNMKITRKFVATVHTTLPIRTASQGVSFAFIHFVINSLITANEL